MRCFARTQFENVPHTALPAEIVANTAVDVTTIDIVITHHATIISRAARPTILLVDIIRRTMTAQDGIRETATTTVGLMELTRTIATVHHRRGSHFHQSGTVIGRQDIVMIRRTRIGVRVHTLTPKRNPCSFTMQIITFSSVHQVRLSRSLKPQLRTVTSDDSKK